MPIKMGLYMFYRRGDMFYRRGDQGPTPYGGGYKSVISERLLYNKSLRAATKDICDFIRGKIEECYEETF